MAIQDPPGGHPMFLAIVQLAIGSIAEVAADYMRMYPTMSRQWREETRMFLWDVLCSRVHAGELEFRGVPTGSNSATVIDPMSLPGSTPDFAAHTLMAAGTLYHGVGVFSVARSSTLDDIDAAEISAPIGSPKATMPSAKEVRARVSGLDFSGADQLLVERMHQLEQIPTEPIQDACPARA